MPTYVYACQSCGAEFEQFQRFSDEPLTVCPRCQGRVKRVFQPVGIVFKGSGWYINDSRNTNKTTTPAAKSEASTAKETAEKPATPSSDSPKTSDAPAKPASEPAKSSS